MKYINKFFILRLVIFILLLFVSNYYLLQPGLWFYQDASGWSKNLVEAFHAINEHLVIFGPGYSNYYHGYDKGILVFLGLIHPIYSYFLISIFGAESSQAIFIISGYILVFFSFYLFSGIFFQDSRVRYFLSILYTFNPLSFSTLGAVYLLAGLPLYMYSFYMFTNKNKTISIKWILLNILSAYLMISYVRFALINLVVLSAYFYILIRDFDKAKFTKMLLLFLIYLLVFLPFILSILFHITEKSETAVFYTKLLSDQLPHTEMYKAFNLLQSFNLKLYSSNNWIVIGLCYFAYFLYLIVCMSKKYYTKFFILNLLLMLLGLSLFSYGRIFPPEMHLFAISIFPFISNGSEWALYIILIPFILLLGYITQRNIKHLYIFTITFVMLCVLPFHNSNDFQLKKYKLSNIPQPYQEYFLSPYFGIPKPTYYHPDMCWRAQYMDNADTPTLCINKGIKFSTIALANPRVLSGVDYYFSAFLQNKINLENLRITHNLKNIIIPNDMVPAKGPGPLITNKDIVAVSNFNQAMHNKEELDLSYNFNFNRYFFDDSNNYDFLLYSPRSFSQLDDYSKLLDKELDIDKVPVIISSKIASKYWLPQRTRVEYKFDPLNPTIYYVKLDLSNIDRHVLLQLNQSFSDGWKVKLIEKYHYDEKKCKSNREFYRITNNSYCQVAIGALSLNDTIEILDNDSLKIGHFRGNILGNLWLINDLDLKKYQNSNTIYLALVYEKQIYYTICLIISFSIIILIILLTVLQEIKNKFNKYE